MLKGGADNPKRSIIQRFRIPVLGAASAHHATAPRKEDRKKGIRVNASRVLRKGISVLAWNQASETPVKHEKTDGPSAMIKVFSEASNTSEVEKVVVKFVNVNMDFPASGWVTNALYIKTDTGRMARMVSRPSEPSFSEFSELKNRPAREEAAAGALAPAPRASISGFDALLNV